MDSLQQFWSLLSEVDGSKIKTIAADHMGLALALCFVSGLLTSLTPCVYPMIPITINIFGRAAQKSSGRSGAFNPATFRLSVIYVAGMCFTYSVMGVLAGITGSLFGSVLQSSFMLGFLTLLFFSLALGQLGFFKLSLPPSMQTTIAQYGSPDSTFGVFLMGLFSGLIVSPCVGPVIAGILAFVFDSSNAFLGFAYFLSFSLGLGVLFLVIGGFSGILARLPRSGNWMNRVNRILALFMLMAAGYYGSVWAKQVGLWKSERVSSLVWMSDEKLAISEVQKRRVPVIVDFAAEWCAACKEIDDLIFGDPRVIEELKNFVLLRLDVTNNSAEDSALLGRYMVQSLPTIAFLDSTGNILAQPRVTGVVAVESFLTVLKQVQTSISAPQ